MMKFEPKPVHSHEVGAAADRTHKFCVAIDPVKKVCICIEFEYFLHLFKVVQYEARQIFDEAQQ